MENTEIKFLGDLQRLELKEGDQFVLTCDRILSYEQAAVILKSWNFFMPDIKLLVLDGGMKLGTIGAEQLKKVNEKT